MASLASSACILISFLLSTTLPLYAADRGGFSLELLHRDSPQSPYYDPSVTPFARLRAASHRSTSRAADYFRRLNPAFSVAASNGSSFQSEVIPNNFEYLMTLYLGTPPSKILAVADTGSDITWTQCKPCTSCYEQDAPLFDPKNSSTYRGLPCDSRLCQQAHTPSCSDNRCIYEVIYGDRSHTEGVLSSETFGFDAAGGRRVSIPNMAFGCSHDTNGTFDRNGSGIVGLGGGPLSLVSQLGSAIDRKFSYCLVPYSDQNSSTSLLNFGKNAVVGGGNVVSTPLLSQRTPTFYYLTLEAITIGGEGEEKIAVLDSSPSPLASTGGNIIIDSGTTLILLEDDVVQQLQDKLSKIIKLPQVSSPGDPFSLCFDASSSSPDHDIPDMAFEFSGATVKLRPMHTFLTPEEGVLCLGIVSNGGVGVSIYGNIAQQNFHIGYDLGEQKLSIAPADCAKL